MLIQLKYRLTELIDIAGKTRDGKAAIRKELLKALSVDQSEPVSPATLSAWCNYRIDSPSEIKMSSLIIIANVLKCKVGDLLNQESKLSKQYNKVAA